MPSSSKRYAPYPPRPPGAPPRRRRRRTIPIRETETAEEDNGSPQALVPAADREVVRTARVSEPYEGGEDANASSRQLVPATAETPHDPLPVPLPPLTRFTRNSSDSIQILSRSTMLHMIRHLPLQERTLVVYRLWTADGSPIGQIQSQNDALLTPLLQIHAIMQEQRALPDEATMVQVQTLTETPAVLERILTPISDMLLDAALRTVPMEVLLRVFPPQPEAQTVTHRLPPLRLPSPDLEFQLHRLIHRLAPRDIPTPTPTPPQIQELADADFDGDERMTDAPPPAPELGLVTVNEHPQVELLRNLMDVDNDASAAPINQTMTDVPRAIPSTEVGVRDADGNVIMQDQEPFRSAKELIDFFEVAMQNNEIDIASLTPNRIAHVLASMRMRMTSLKQQITARIASGDVIPDALYEQYDLAEVEHDGLLQRAQELYPDLKLSVTDHAEETDAQRVRRMNSLLKDLDKLKSQYLEKAKSTEDVRQIDAQIYWLEREIQKLEPDMEKIQNSVLNAMDEMERYNRQLPVENEDKDEDRFTPAGYDRMRQIYLQQTETLRAIQSQINDAMASNNLEKAAALEAEWQQIMNEDPHKTWTTFKDAYDTFMENSYEQWNNEMNNVIKAHFDGLSQSLFGAYESGKRFTTYNEHYNALVKEYFAIRQTFYEKRNLDFKDYRGYEDDLWLNGLQSRMETLGERIQEWGAPILDPYRVLGELKRRADVLQKRLDQDKTAVEEAGQKWVAQPVDKAIHDKLLSSYQSLVQQVTVDEVYKVMSNEFPETWTDAVNQLQAEIQSLRSRVKEDVSAFGPFLERALRNIFLRFSERIQNAPPQERADFEEVIKSERDFVYKIISKEAARLTGLKPPFSKAATESKLLQKYVMEPQTFSEQDVAASSLTLYLSDTRALLRVLEQSMDLRSKMVGEAYRIMGIEGSNDGPKFDVVLTHLFPPSQVEFKLKYLLSLPADTRKRYANGIFAYAIQQILPDFDLQTLTPDNLLQKVGEIGEATRGFLQGVVAPSNVAWGDFESMGDQLTRMQMHILSQLETPNTREQLLADLGQRSVDVFDSPNISDPDAGATMQASGIRVDSTMNPTSGGQLIRDRVDDVKRQQYLQGKHQQYRQSMVRSMVSVFLDAPDGNDAYVPMHPSSAKFFFSSINYGNLKTQFMSMKPLIPKQTVEDPNGVINGIVSEYGPILGIKQRTTKLTDHPALIQKEAIELQEFVQAYQAYIYKTEGNFVHATEGQPSMPPQSADAPAASEPEVTKPQTSTQLGEVDELDPNDTGADRFGSSLQRYFQNNPVQTPSTSDPFSNPFM